MKKYFLYIAAAAFLMAACNKDHLENPEDQPVTGIITMTTLASEVSLGFFYNESTFGGLTIYWGDGTKTVIDGINSSTKTGYFYTDYYSRDYFHSYSGVSERTITITGNDNLIFACYNNQLSALDVSGYPALLSLFCQDNNLTTLDVSHNTSLYVLDCGNNQLTALDVSANPILTRLKCYDNQLTTIDVSHNTVLDVLYCQNNQLTDLDLSRNTELTDLECRNNQLTALDVSHNGWLGNLGCNNNRLTTLDLSRNTWLWRLTCISNQLTSLDASHNITLVILDCGGNQLAATALNDLFGTLQDSVDSYHDGGSRINYLGRRVNITGNPGASDCNMSIAKDKEWKVTR